MYLCVCVCVRAAHHWGFWSQCGSAASSDGHVGHIRSCEWVLPVTEMLHVCLHALCVLLPACVQAAHLPDACYFQNVGRAPHVCKKRATFNLYGCTYAA